MKILATVLMTSALLAGCSMPGTQRNNAVQGGQSQAKSTVQPAASDMPTRAADGRLIGPTGNTLYTFGKDTNGRSNCNGQCATNWPPLAVEANAKAMGDYTIITRADGTRQEVTVMLRVDTPIEVDYYRNGGILPYVLRQLLA